MTTTIPSSPLFGDGALRPLIRSETGLNDVACVRPGLSHDWLCIVTGVYTPRVTWREIAWVERYELLLEVAHRKYGEDLMLVGAPAIAAYGLPLVETVLRRVEVVGGRPGRVRTSLLRRHARCPGAKIARVGGHLAVALSDALIDLARWNGFMTGVIAIDAAPYNGLCSAKGLQEALARLSKMAGGGLRARQTVCLVDGRSESPGESLFRARMREPRLPKSELQVSARVRSELYILDFRWPDHRATEEFDDRVKYRSAFFGEDSKDVVWCEKPREDVL